MSKRDEKERFALAFYDLLFDYGGDAVPVRKPQLADYGVSESDVRAAERSKAISDSQCEKLFHGLLFLLFVIFSFLFGSLNYSKEKNIVLSVLVGLFLSVVPAFLLGAFIEDLVQKTWDKILVSKHPTHHATLTKYYEYRYDLRRFEYHQERLRKEFWTGLDGRQFEIELAALYKRLGCSVETTPYVRDEGIDIVLARDGQLIVVQCKRYNKPVGVAAARELYGVLKDKGVSEAILACTSGFTKGVVDFVRDKPIRLVGLEDITAMQKSLSDEAKT
jgi:Holliday junction resolvase